MDAVSTGAGLAHTIYEIIKRRFREATRQMIEDAVREEVARQLALNRWPGIEINVRTLHVLVEQVVVFAHHDGLVREDDIVVPAFENGGRRSLPVAARPALPATKAPAVLEGAPEPAVVLDSAACDPRPEPQPNGLPSAARVAEMRNELERSLRTQYGDDVVEDTEA
jgi:transcriptional regulator with GAF, ATPase, and Fis domain